MENTDKLYAVAESYLTAVVAGVTNRDRAQVDTRLPFGESGVDSFHVLKIVKEMEAVFGRLPKTLLFEYFNIHDLSNYFVEHHAAALERLMGSAVAAPAYIGRPVASAATANSVTVTQNESTPIFMLLAEALKDSAIAEAMAAAYLEYKNESSVSRGTKNIAPNVFIDRTKKAYVNYSRYQNIILAYAYTGPDELFDSVVHDLLQHCQRKGYELNLLIDRPLKNVAGVEFTSTPFGAVQRIQNLQDFQLEGGKMRKLRYLVNKFEKSGECRTAEYRVGESDEVDADIVRVIDQWCGDRAMVNPLVFIAREQISNKTFSQEHRVFLTSVDGVLQNVIVITALSKRMNGYLMDLEFYPKTMPLGGLEFAINNIISQLVSEGCTLFSLGATFGPKIVEVESADKDVEFVLDELRARNIFNDQGNLQFKNKFGTENDVIYLCRPKSQTGSDTVIDIVMMIADPEKMQTSDEENFGNAQALTVDTSQRQLAPAPTDCLPVVSETHSFKWELVDACFNTNELSGNSIRFDLKTDSWAQLSLPFIGRHMAKVKGQLQRSANLREELQHYFPFSHFALTNSGRNAESAFFQAWEKRGEVVQNLLFPSNIYNQIDKGFTPVEIPSESLYDSVCVASPVGGIDLTALKQYLVESSERITMLCLEVGNNASGGNAVSIEHVAQIKSILSPYKIPLVIDCTRVIDNVIANTGLSTAESVLIRVRQLLSCADVVVASLAKNFCVNFGGLVASNDDKLIDRVSRFSSLEGSSLDVVSKRVLAQSLFDKAFICTQSEKRLNNVRLIADVLIANHLPVVEPVGGHCILLDPKITAPFAQFEHPAASFCAWLYQATGIRVAGHNVGMQNGGPLRERVRVAIPYGLTKDEAIEIANAIVSAFKSVKNVPELQKRSSKGAGFGDYDAQFDVVRLHNYDLASLGASFAMNTGGSKQDTRALSRQTGPVSVSDSASSAVIPSQMSERHQAQNNEVIAIVGIAGRYPKARNSAELWNNLINGLDCIEEIPDERFLKRKQHVFSQRYRGGFISDIDKFDSLFFNISPREAKVLDPQERLFLEVAWEALEDAGYFPESLAEEGQKRDIGVYVGAVWATYQILGVEQKLEGQNISPNSFLWSIANRVSYWMNLTGPSLTLDTACSSSLTAIHLACEAIRNRECSAAIVGGVNLDTHQHKWDINHAGGALSPDGLCRSFGAGANGYVAGEGVCAILLKPLAKAISAGDHIYGVIRSVAVNHGGRTSGYTVPNPKAQSDLISSALKKANVDAKTLGYIEAHGTGTELGDPVEIAGLTDAFKQFDVANGRCAIGSIKSNIGHLEAAAGIAGVIKILLQMKHKQLVPSLHSAVTNEHIDFQNSPFSVVQSLRPWPRQIDKNVELPLRAGVSSFGAGGANAHVILEEFVAKSTAATTSNSIFSTLFPLSARTEEQLVQMAERLRRHLIASSTAEKGGQDAVKLADVAFTLHIGRKSFDERLLIVADDLPQLLDRLEKFLGGVRDVNIFRGNTKSGGQIGKMLSRQEKEGFVALMCQGQDARKIAQLWVDGVIADWQGLNAVAIGKRISLPTYPFDDKRHWIDESASAPQNGLNSRKTNFATLHPLIDSNESTFNRQLFKKVFDESEFFIFDHKVSDVFTLPGVAYLDWARQAGEISTGRKVRKIKNVIWLSPLVVQPGHTTEAFIELKPQNEVIAFEVFSENAADGKRVYAQGKLEFARSDSPYEADDFVDLKSLREQCKPLMVTEEIYPLFKTLGLDLGRSFQVVKSIAKSEKAVLGELALPQIEGGALGQFLLHPSLMDGSLQAGMGASIADNRDDMFVPYSISEVEIFHPLESVCYSIVTKVDEPDSKVSKANVCIVDADGKVLVKIKESIGVRLVDVHAKPAKAATEKTSADKVLVFEPVWKPAPAEGKTHTGAVVFFDRDDALVARYRDKLQVSGGDPARGVWVQFASEFRCLDKSNYCINPKSAADIARLFAELEISEVDVSSLYIGATERPFDCETSAVQRDLDESVYFLLSLCQTMLAQKHVTSSQLIYGYSFGDALPTPVHDAINGFFSTLHVEQNQIRGKTIGFDTRSADEMLGNILTELDEENEFHAAIRYVNRQRLVRTFEKSPTVGVDDAELSREVSFKQNGCYLITGGCGGLGRIFAQHLATKFQARLVLTGRSAFSDDVQAELDQLSALGGKAIYVQADVTDKDSIAKVVQLAIANFGALNGILHSAGVLRDSYLRAKTPNEMDDVFKPKVFGTINLDNATQYLDLDFFVTFSSLAAVGGNIGQCDYAYANHFMDSYQQWRAELVEKNLRKGRSLSINWSLWANGGMKLDEQTELFFRKNLGIKPLAENNGIAALEAGLVSNGVQIAVIEGDEDKIGALWGKHGRQSKTSKAKVAENGSSTSQTQFIESSTDGLSAQVQQRLTELVAKFLQLDLSDVPSDGILTDLGFDSMGLTSFANTINENYKLDVTPVLFFEHPSVEEIASFIANKHAAEARSVHATPTRTEQVNPNVDHVTPVGKNATDASFTLSKAWVQPESTAMVSGSLDTTMKSRFRQMPIAIVGASGVMPQSDNLQEFWRNLRDENEQLVTLIPADRWSWQRYFGDPLQEENKTQSKWGGFMREIDMFDPLFWGISPREAEMMDPQQRIFLENVWQAIEDSGHRVSELAGTRTGLFVGAATRDYVDLMNTQNASLDGYSASGTSHAILANRVSFLLDLRGPSAPLDTACSSSLLALHRAIESIHTGSCDMAIVGGVQVMLTPAGHISFGRAGMLASDGRCKTFDESANGYVRGEGSGAIFIKPLAMAEADGDHIYAVVKSTAENHGGRATMLTAPNPNAQSELLIEAYEKAQIDPTTVGMIECHGTGTSLGDPIEIQAMKRAFEHLYATHGKSLPAEPHIALTSVKTNIGHLETAAGIAGILKVIMSIKHRQIPALLHFKKQNPYINIQKTPFYMVEKTKTWNAINDANGNALPRRAGVSSFGFGGANVHIVLEEYLDKRLTKRAGDKKPQLIVLSAKTPDRLKAYAGLMIDFLENNDVDLSCFAYTLQMGRDAMEYRLGFVAETVADAIAGFSEYLSGASASRHHLNAARVTSKTRKDSLADPDLLQLVHEGRRAELVQKWTTGSLINWTLLHGDTKPMRISMPTYPFARERYWFEAGKEAKGDAKTVSRLHPLLHENISTLGRTIFCSQFSDVESPIKAAKRLNTSGDQGALNMQAALMLTLMAKAAAEIAQPETSVQPLSLNDLSWDLPAADLTKVPFFVELSRADEHNIHFDVYCGSNDSVGLAEQMLHRGVMSLGAQPSKRQLDVALLLEQLKHGALSAEDFAQDYLGVSGEPDRISTLFDQAYRGDDQLLITLSLATTDSHPDLLLCDQLAGVLRCVQRMAAVVQAEELQSIVADTISFNGSISRAHYVWVRRARHREHARNAFNIDFLSLSGDVMLSIKALQLVCDGSTSTTNNRSSRFAAMLAQFGEAKSQSNNAAQYSFQQLLEKLK